MEEVKYIVIHGAYTTPSMDVGADDIKEWHVDDNKWSDIGYHYVITRDGTVEDGADDETPGAHVIGYNQESIGIVLAGGRSETSDGWEFNYTHKQLVETYKLAKKLEKDHLCAEVCGHNELDDRECPGFNVKKWYYSS